jgi:hypothetical protein
MKCPLDIHLNIEVRWHEAEPFGRAIAIERKWIPANQQLGTDEARTVVVNRCELHCAVRVQLAPKFSYAIELDSTGDSGQLLFHCAAARCNGTPNHVAAR